MFLRIQSGVICNITPSEHLANSILDKVFVGQSRESFSVVKPAHSVIGVCSMFGSFVKFHVVVPHRESEVTSPKRLRIENRKFLPPVLTSTRNRKDELYNSVVQQLSVDGLGWHEPLKYGKPFITNLCNLLWFIDGHHDVFRSRSCTIPTYFSKFVGFNRPELSKHRKRSISNMSREKLLEHAATLQEYAVSSWMQQPDWTEFHNSIMKLIESLSSYASYLSIRNKVMKHHHSSPEPAVAFSDATSVRYFPKAYSVSPLLSSLNSALINVSMYEKIFVNDFAPNDSRQKYLYIRELERGLSCPVFFFTYTHGSNVGNFYFIWKAPEHVCIEACTPENARITEEIKTQIPVYHTRTMKRQFYDLYGRITPKSNSHLLRRKKVSGFSECI